jgi:hypothetical protein
MTTSALVPLALDVTTPPPTPDDFDAGMTERWLAWKARGRIDAARTRQRALVGVALAAAVAFAAFGLSALFVP